MKIYLCGIGGIGMSAYAALQRAMGHDVLGSDRTESDLLDDLRTQGIGVTLMQDGTAVPADADLFVYSEAVPDDHPERVQARASGIRSVSYAQALGELSAGNTVIAVCGTHGKSTTTAMAARVLLDAGLDPTVVVGTKVPELAGRNWRRGAGGLFLLEACEYRHSFHHFSPTTVLMTTVDGDHFDYFPSEDAYREAYVDFLRRLPADGVVITHGSDAACREVALRSGRRLIDADLLPSPELSVPGAHMRQNAQLVLALAEHMGINAAMARTCLQGFSGTWRRMERAGEFQGGIPVVDDYAHHPVEISATLAAMREAYPSKRIVCVFQPHTHDRTLKMYKKFVQSFADADLVILTDTYAARSERDAATVDSVRFAGDIAHASRTAVRYGGTLAATEALLRTELLQAGDVLVCMGAGDVTMLAERMAGTGQRNRS